MKVKDPRGQTWRVTRRWVPWRRKLKGAIEMMPNLPSGDDPISMVITAIVLILFLPVIVIVLLSGIELLLVLLVLPFAALGRVLFGQQWTIEARRGWTPWWEAQAGDWRQSGQAIRDVATAIEKGVLPPGNLEGQGSLKSPGNLRGQGADQDSAAAGG